MADATSHDDALEALKAFNTAITTTRIYPADAPQVQASVEKAYKAITYYLRNSLDLVFSLENDEGMLCGSPIQKQTLGKLHGADVFQHLKLLGLPYTVIRPGIVRETFQQILAFFITSPQKIRREGGGAVYAAQLGLGEVFPARYRVQNQPGLMEISVPLSASSPDVRDEWIGYFLNKDEDPDDSLAASTVFKNSTLAAKTITASIVKAFSRVQEEEKIEPSPDFQQIIARADGRIGQAQRGEVVAGTAALLLEGFKGPVLSMLLSQDFSGAFGTALFAALMARVNTAHFKEVIEHLAAREEAAREDLGPGSPQVRQADAVRARLLDTTKGRQFLALEKARIIMETGEKERRGKRIRAGLNAILQGNADVLRHDEIAEHLPATVERLLVNRKDSTAAMLIENVAKEMLKGDAGVRARLSRSLSHIGGILLKAGKWDWLEKLAGPLLVWVNGADEGNAVYERIVTVLQKVMLHGWRTGNTRTADQILTVLFKIRSGLIAKPQAVRELTGRVQDQCFDWSLLPVLLSQCLADPANETLGQRLSMQGPLAARFLIKTLLASDNAGERIGILELLANMGSLLAPVIIEQLPHPMPWYGKRNLLKLLAETGKEEHTGAAMEFMTHDDLRVQREAFSCIYKISGSQRKQALLQALGLASESMKGQVVKALSALVDEDVIAALADLLVDLQNFSPEVRSPLTQQICRVLLRSSSRNVKDALENLLSLQGRGGAGRPDPEVKSIVEGAVKQIEANQRKQARLSRQLDNSPSLPTGAASLAADKEEKVRKYLTDFPEEVEIRRLLEQMNTVKAKVLLVDLIGKAAGMKQFLQAEKLRDWLIQIDPTAFIEIIRTAELIENEQVPIIDKDQLETWFGLYDMLSTEEYNAFFRAVSCQQYDPEEMIAKQGEPLTSLFFINSGRVKLTFSENGQETLFGIMERGEIIGANSFFNASAWTVSATALGFTEISVLAQDKVKGWQKDYPELEGKLHDFCLKYDGRKDVFLKDGNEEPAEEQIPVSARIEVTLLDQSGREAGLVIAGNLADVSGGGLSCLIGIARKKSVRCLLGQKVRVGFPAGSGIPGSPPAINGTFVALSPSRSVQNEYHVDVRFDQPLPQKDLAEFVTAMQRKM